MSRGNEAGQRGLCDPRHVRGRQRGRPRDIRDNYDEYLLIQDGGLSLLRRLEPRLLVSRGALG